MKTVILTAASVLLSWGTLSPISWGAQNWATGPTLQKRLNETMDIVLAENPLRRAVENLSRTKNVAVLIDRRIDPGQKIDISLQQTPLKEVLEAIAEKCGSAVTMIGPVAYFGPSDAVQRTRALIALRQNDVRRLSPAVAMKFSQQKAIAWDDLAMPRELLERLGRQSGIEISGLDQVPHDLWAAADLPPLGLIERITLIAGQYDLTFTISTDGKQITLLPAPENVAVHESIAEPRRQVEPKPPKPADNDITLKRYTLKVVEKPIGPLLKQLAKQMNIEIRVDDRAMKQAGLSLEQRVSFSVKNATIDELLRAALKQTRLQCVRQGTVVTIEPSKD